MSADEIEADPLDLENQNTEIPVLEARPASRLIEFPGVTRHALPQWRKELSERVREVQERRAREAALEPVVAGAPREHLIHSSQPPPPQLELLPQAETPEINPVLAAALRRLERAYQRGTSNSYSRTATAVAVAPNHQPEEEVALEIPPTMEATQLNEPAPIPERTHNLVVVQSPIAVQPEPEKEKPKPKRLIADDLNDPALSYLDSISRGCEPATANDRASLATRVVAALVDVIAVGFLSLPFAAVIELRNGNWHQPRIIGLMAGIAAVLMFLYATVSTALTGRTFGMRLLSLRAIDERTKLIPTGKQAAGRALVYLLTLATVGVGLLLAFARGEGKTAHDRLTRTAVVRD